MKALLSALALFSLPAAGLAQNTADFAPFVFVDDVPNVIVLNGEIDFRTPLAFRRALAAHPGTHTIALNSVGGSVQAGLLVAEEVYERGLNTLIIEDFQCLSACSFIFFAGRERLAEGKLGVHQISGGGDIEDAQLNLSDILETLAKYGVSQDVITRMLRTRPDEMYVFSNQEIASLGINHSPSMGRQVAVSPPKQDTASEVRSSAGENREIMAKAFILGFILSGSLPTDDLAEMAGNAYSDTVEFYGKELSKVEVIQDKRKYAERWPERISTARPSTIQVLCVGELCRVTGIYDWTVSNDAKRKRLTGSATFDYIVDMSAGTYRIVSENGTVLERRSQ